MELWTDYTTHEQGEGLSGSVMILSQFASLQMVEAFHDEMVRDGEESLEVFVKKMLTMFEPAMESYANLGRSIYEATLEDMAQRPHVSSAIAGRIDPCPCGSGKKYKHCCLQ